MRKLTEQEEIVAAGGNQNFILKMMIALSDDAIILAQKMNLFDKLMKQYQAFRYGPQGAELKKKLFTLKQDINQKKEEMKDKKEKIKELKNRERR